jgi:F420-dependent oxidoreductase-like protein
MDVPGSLVGGTVQQLRHGGCTLLSWRQTLVMTVIGKGTTQMRYGLGVGEAVEPATLKQTVERVRVAAAAGFATAWWAQLSNWDALTAIAVAGAQVPGIALGTAVVPTYPRHPLMLASQALSVQAATDNRLRLGIGPSHQWLMEDRYGYPFERPARHVREYLSALMPLLRGESLSYEGETLRAIGEIHVPDAEAPSVMLAALGPVMLKIAGELTDGTITAWTGPKTLAGYIVPTITRAAAAAGRPAPQVIAGGLVCVTAHPHEIREETGVQFASVAQAPSYGAMLEREGIENPADLLILGDETTVEREIQRYADAGVTELIVYVTGSAEEQARTMDLLTALARGSAPASARR